MQFQSVSMCRTAFPVFCLSVCFNTVSLAIKCEASTFQSTIEISTYCIYTVTITEYETTFRRSTYSVVYIRNIPTYRVQYIYSVQCRDGMGKLKKASANWRTMTLGKDSLLRVPITDSPLSTDEMPRCVPLCDAF